MIVAAARASAILYNLLRARRDPRPVLMPAAACVDLPLAILRAGCGVELVDIEEAGLGLDRRECLRRVAAAPSRYGGVVFVHPYGAESDPEPFFDELRRLAPELLLIDDRCLCPPDPAARGGAASADAVLWSTGPRKSLDLGAGGYARLRAGASYRPLEEPFDPAARAALEAAAKAALRAGGPLPAASGPWLDLGPPPWPWPEYRARLEQALPQATARRNGFNEIYRSAIPERAQMPGRFQNWRFNVLVADPDRLMARLAESALFAGRHYPSLGPSLAGGRFPRAEALHSRVVNLFNDGCLDEPQARAAARLVDDHLRHAG